MKETMLEQVFMGVSNKHRLYIRVAKRECNECR